MSIIFKKVNDFEEIQEGNLYAIANVENTKCAISNGDLISFLTYKVMSRSKYEALLIVNGDSPLRSDNDLVLTKDSFKHLNIHKVELPATTKDIKDVEQKDCETVVTLLKRQLRKLNKKNKALKAILKKHNIATNEESQQLKEHIKKLNKFRTSSAIIATDKLTENIFGYKATIIVGTNYSDEVEVLIYVGKKQTAIGVENLKKEICVKGVAKLHPEDKFNYNTGVQLALMRAKLKLMEELVK